MNSSCFSLSCSYHLRNSVDGAIVLSHSSHGASSFRWPRGQIRSTSTARPQLGRPSLTCETCIRCLFVAISSSANCLVRPCCEVERKDGTACYDVRSTCLLNPSLS